MEKGKELPRLTEKAQPAVLFELRLVDLAKAMEEMIAAYLPEETGHQKSVLAAMNYAVKAGGKRLRPMMLRLCYEMFAKEPQEALVRPFMAAMEMIHTYSLVHDDLPAMDNDALRR